MISIPMKQRLLDLRTVIVKGSQNDSLQALDLLVRDLGPADIFMRPEPGEFEAFKQPTRHWKSQRFHDILDELKALHDRKQKDYGSDSDPFLNVSASQDWNISPVVGALLRMTDKVRRLQSWVRNGNLANEGAEDSMRDISVYAVIALVLHEVETGKSKAPTSESA